MKRLMPIAATAMVFACDSRVRMPQGHSDLEHSEKIAIQSLSDADKTAYLKRKPLKVIRGGFLVGQPVDKLTFEVLAVQRTRLSTGLGWRMEIVVGSDLAVFRVPDQGQAQVLSVEREYLKNATTRRASDAYNPFADPGNYEQAEPTDPFADGGESEQDVHGNTH